MLTKKGTSISEIDKFLLLLFIFLFDRQDNDHLSFKIRRKFRGDCYIHSSLFTFQKWRNEHDFISKIFSYFFNFKISRSVTLS